MEARLLNSSAPAAPQFGDAEGCRLEDFEVEEQAEGRGLLGHGSFAKVYLARGRRDKQLYALKAVG